VTSPEVDAVFQRLKADVLAHAQHEERTPDLEGPPAFPISRVRCGRRRRRATSKMACTRPATTTWALMRTGSPTPSNVRAQSLTNALRPSVPTPPSTRSPHADENEGRR
jgi:hypothetical protein